MKILTRILTVAVSALTLTIAWDPGAGLIPSLTRNQPVNVTSAPENAANIVDGNTETFWQSGACLPTGFIIRGDLNILLDACASQRCSASGDSPDLELATNGDFYGGPVVQVVDGEALFVVQFEAGRNSLKRIHLRAKYDGPTTLTIRSPQGDVILATMSPDDSYSDIIISEVHNESTELIIESEFSFQLYEVAALTTDPCYEMAVVDVNFQEIGVIKTRHWAGSNAAYATELLMSNDGQTWTKIADLDPENLDVYSTRLDHPINTQYIAIKHFVFEKDYQKVYVWEISAWDRYGPYGPFPEPVFNPISMSDLLGVNGIWGWQTGSYSDSIPPNQGTQLYNQIGTHARNYHNMNWDVLEPSSIPDYEAMANGEGTEVHWWLNWDKEYQVWSDDFQLPYAAVQFTNKPSDMPFEEWTDPYLNGYNFAYAFASHFGNITGTGHLKAMEIGNEPWDYPPEFYPEVFLGMASGARDSGSDILVFPCALQGHDEFSVNNYLGHNFNETHSELVHGVNTHIYSFLRNASGQRIAVNPEHPDSGFNEVRNTLKWRNANVPNMPVWVTEWGWDSDGVGEDCANTECVSEDLQAVYGVRGLALLSRMGIQKAAWFFFANSENCNTLFCRSGLTGSVSTGFAKKKVFNAFDAFLKLAGNVHFAGTIMEDQNGFVYRLGNSTNSDTHLMLWQPVTEYDVEPIELEFEYSGGKPSKSWVITGDTDNAEEVENPIVTGNVWKAQVTAKPVIVELESVKKGKRRGRKGKGRKNRKSKGKRKNP